MKFYRKFVKTIYRETANLFRPPFYSLFYFPVLRQFINHLFEFDDLLNSIFLLPFCMEFQLSFHKLYPLVPFVVEVLFVTAID